MILNLLNFFCVRNHYLVNHMLAESLEKFLCPQNVFTAKLQQGFGSSLSTTEASTTVLK